MASFSETLDLAKEEEIWYLILLQRRRRRQRKRLWSVNPINQSREPRGECVLVNQMREMDEERHFWYLGCLNIVLMTTYIGLHPTSNTKTPKDPQNFFHRAVALRIIWVITTVCSVSRSSNHPFCDIIFFSSASLHLLGNDRTLGPANQSKCETIQNNVCNVTYFDGCKTLLGDTFFCCCFFYVIFVCWQTLVFRE